MSNTNGGDDGAFDRAQLLRAINHNLELLEILRKLTPNVDRLSRDLYDHRGVVETRLDYTVNEQRVHQGTVREMLEKHVAAASAQVDKIHALFVEIAKSTALASNDAGDAKTAALGLKKEVTGSFPLQKPEDGERVALLKVFGHLPARSQIMLLIMLLLSFLAGGTGIGHWLRGLGGEGEHHRALPPKSEVVKP